VSNVRCLISPTYGRSAGGVDGQGWRNGGGKSA